MIIQSNCANSLVNVLLSLQLRLYKNELAIEEVIRGRTQGIFHEKCRDYYTISNSNSWYNEVFKTLDIFSYVIACSTKSSIQTPSLWIQWFNAYGLMLYLIVVHCQQDWFYWYVTTNIYNKQCVISSNTYSLQLVE